MADYEYVGPKGQILDRATILQIIISPGYALTSGIRTEVRLVEIEPDVIAVKHRWQGSVTYEGRSFKNDQRCTMLCVHRHDKCLVGHEQCSPVGS